MGKNPRGWNRHVQNAHEELYAEAFGLVQRVVGRMLIEKRAHALLTISNYRLATACFSFP